MESQGGSMSVSSLEIKVKRMHKDAAAMKVSATVRVYIEDNPRFAGPVKLHVLSFKGESLDGLNCEETLNASCLCALQQKSVQKHALQLIKNNYSSVKAIIEVSQTEAHVVIF